MDGNAAKKWFGKEQNARDVVLLGAGFLRHVKGVTTCLGRYIWQLSCQNIVAFDPLRRRQVRIAAKRLVPAKAWVNNNATADEIARIALLRVLFLQRETRRAARHADEEASVMLARASIETAIGGLFCIYVPEAEKHFDGETFKRIPRLLAGFTKSVGLAKMFDDAFNQLADDKLPNVSMMIKQIIGCGGGTGIDSLHTDFYDKISTLYIHSGPLALLRHVHPKKQRTRERPYSAWSKRSAVHMSDAMVGLLAATIAGNDCPDIALFQRYMQVHYQIIPPPWAVVTRGLMVTNVNYRYLPDMFRLIRFLVSKQKGGEPFSEADAEKLVTALAVLFSVDSADPTFSPIADIFRKMLINPDSFEFQQNASIWYVKLLICIVSQITATNTHSGVPLREDHPESRWNS